MGYGGIESRRETRGNPPRELKVLFFETELDIAIIKQLGNPGQNPETPTQVRSDIYNGGGGVAFVRFPERPNDEEENCSLWYDKFPEEGEVSVQARIPTYTPDDWSGEPLLTAEKLLTHALEEIKENQ